MTTQPKRSLDQILNGLDRPLTVQCVAYLQRRMSRDAVILDLLRARLTHLVTDEPAATDSDELLTADEAAARLKLSRPRIYELVRQGRLPKVQFGKQIRIPSRGLDTTNSPTTSSS
jgi:excisionase family DNA binding protein